MKFNDILLKFYSDTPHIAGHGCYAIYNIAESFAEDANDDSNPLTEFYLFLIGEVRLYILID
jgi:hypothetical protein